MHNNHCSLNSWSCCLIMNVYGFKSLLGRRILDSSRPHFLKDVKIPLLHLFFFLFLSLLLSLSPLLFFLKNSKPHRHIKDWIGFSATICMYSPGPFENKVFLWSHCSPENRCFKCTVPQCAMQTCPFPASFPFWILF